jgi:uncharacterized membrane protein YdjX (TVP38/TMEM64 family)
VSPNAHHSTNSHTFTPATLAGHVGLTGDETVRVAGHGVKIRARILVPLVLGVIALVVAVLLRRELHGHVVDMKAWVGGLGILGAIIFVAAFVILTCIMVPDTLMSIAAGAVFGFVGAVAVIVIGATIARAVQYVLARRVLQQRVQRYVATRPRLMRIERAVRQDQLRLQLLIRLTPMSPTLLSYLFGAMAVRFGGFMLALVATIPGLLVSIYLGVEGTHVVEMTARPDGEIVFQDFLKIGGLLVSGATLVVITRTALRAVNRTADAHEP